MDRMSHNTPIPTEQQFLQLAQEQNVEPVIEALDALAETNVTSELAKKLEALGLKVELARVFSSAHTELSQLYDERPTAAKADATAALQNEPETIQQVRGFEERIGGYLRGFREKVDKITAKNSESAAPDFAPLKNRLSDETTRSQALKSLSALPNVTVDQSSWIREQARDTALSVTEILWEVVAIGRDFVGLSASNEKEAAASAFKDWQQGIDSDLPEAQKLLTEAVKWLTQE